MSRAGPIAAHSLTDLDLAAQAAYRDPEAFEAVYRRYGDMVYGLAWRMSGDATLAEDLSQEVFLRVFRHMASFRGRASLKTWIYRIALNCCRTRLGRRGRRQRHFEDIGEDGLERHPDPAPGPDGHTLDRERRRRLAGLLARVPFVFREAVVLRDIQGLAYEEIASVLGVRIGTVRSRIARGRKALHELVREDSR